MQEIQEALDERQNNFDSILNHNQTNTPLAEPFQFESQIDTDTYPIDLTSKSNDESLQSETNISNETIPLLPIRNEREQLKINHNHQQKPIWTSAKDLTNIKNEIITPPKTKRRHSKILSNSKKKQLSSIPSMHQMTMTQLFDRIESPRLTRNVSPIKQELQTPTDDTSLFMPESLIGLAQPSESMSDNENDHNDLSSLISPIKKLKTFKSQLLKRKTISSPIINNNISEQITTDKEDNNQNETHHNSPYSGIENEELLYACPMCRNYWLGLPEELRHKQNLTCRHRQRPVARTPEHFWSLGIPNTQTCIERGYGGVLPPDKPIQRPRRPRRQHQRKLQEQQQQMNNGIIIDDDDDDDDDEDE